MKKVLGILVTVSLLLFACNKKDDYDAQKQLAKDDALIREFIAANNIPAKKDTTGIYYVISNPGNGNINYTANTNVRVKYKLRLLNGSEIPQTTEAVNFYLGQVIPGWQFGIPKIQPGGKIRLIIPSIYAYKDQAQSGIPANSVLDFDIELIGVNNTIN